MGRALRWAGLVLAAMVSAVAAPAQNGPVNEPVRMDRILRVIDDPHSGDRWWLLADPAHPAGPGRLVLAAHRNPPGLVAGTEGQAPAIRRGEKVLVDEHTATVDACLEAVALEPARIGSQLKVRLTIGSRVVWAVAMAPGRVALAR